MTSVGRVLWSEEKAIVGDMPYPNTTIGYLLLYFKDPADTIYPQIIIGQEEIVVDGSACVRIRVAQPWNIAPQADDAYAAKSLSLLAFDTLTVIPKAITDFGTVAGLT